MNKMKYLRIFSKLLKRVNASEKNALKKTVIECKFLYPSHSNSNNISYMLCRPFNLVCKERCMILKLKRKDFAEVLLF